LSAYEAQQAEVKALAARFTQSGYSLKQLLAELVLSNWYRADKLSGKAGNGDASSARALALVSGEKLLTPEALASKTHALTGFNWNAQTDFTTGLPLNGLERDYNTYYGGVDGFAHKVRARSLTPLMSNVAAAHAMEVACPIVLGDFIRPDAKRFLFAGLTPWVTPLTEQVGVQTILAASETDFRNYTVKVDLTPGTHQVAISLLNDGCDSSISAAACKADKNLIINTLSIMEPGGQSITLNGSSGSVDACATVNGNSLALNASCTATYNYTADQAGTYTVVASLSAKQQANDPVIAALNVESTLPAGNAATVGALRIKQKLVELHSTLLGQTVTPTSPEVLASYDLLVQSWQSRQAGHYAPSLLQKTLACDWTSDIGFIESLGYPGNPLQANGRYNTAAVTAWLAPQAQDALLMKQSWAVVVAYLLSHYDYLHE
ncbi:MAG: hypothetical protein V4603_11260, partial [Pseudomonadota bacterium]